MRDVLLRVGGTIAAFAFWVGLQVSGFQSTLIAVGSFGIAGLWVVAVLITWEPLRRRLIFLLLGRPTVRLSEQLKTAQDSGVGQETIILEKHGPLGLALSSSRQERDYPKMVREAGHHMRVVWNTEGSLHRNQLLNNLLPHLKTVILPHPDLDKNPSLRELALAAESRDNTDDPKRREDSIEQVRRAIEEVTDRIEEYNERAGRDDPQIGVYWRIGHMGNVFTLSDDWVFVEMFFPAVDANQRPAIQIMKAEYPAVYANLEGSFRSMLTGAKDILAVRVEEKRARLDAMRVRGGQMRVMIARVPDDDIGEATKSDIGRYIKDVKELVRREYPDRLTHWRATDSATTLPEALAAQNRVS